jgi:hypothetical protein
MKRPTTWQGSNAPCGVDPQGRFDSAILDNGGSRSQLCDANCAYCDLGFPSPPQFANQLDRKEIVVEQPSLSCCFPKRRYGSIPVGNPKGVK